MPTALRLLLIPVCLVALSPAPDGAGSPPPAADTPGSPNWSLQPLIRPSIPAVKNVAWVRNPIDAFILARLEQKGLAPASPADRRTLIRRVSFDLIGLPPTPEEIASFLKDT